MNLFHLETTEIILHYFPKISSSQIGQFLSLDHLYKLWNQKINLISRKDIDNLHIHHVLHSLGIAKVVEFEPNHRVLDVGTGGGFPGIPLAILFPDTQFHLIDSIGKKIKVVNEIASELQLTNVTSQQVRADGVKDQFDYVVSRAVTQLDQMIKWTSDLIVKEKDNNSILVLKGGDISVELKNIKHKSRIFKLKDFFEEPFFESKSVVQIFLK